MTTTNDAPAPAPSGSGVRVKPLEWRPAAGDQADRRDIEAPSIVGFYDVLMIHSAYRAVVTLANKVVVIATGLGFEEAKAAAQADYEARILSALASDASPRGEAVAFDPLNGGCPHCKWLDTNLGRVLDKKCELHQRIEDLQTVQQLDRQIIKGLNGMLRRVSEIIGAADDDDPAEIAQNRMDEIAELEAAHPAPATAEPDFREISKPPPATIEAEEVLKAVLDCFGVDGVTRVLASRAALAPATEGRKDEP